MKPIDFPEATVTFTAAPGEEDRVGQLKVCRTRDHAGVPVSISCFELEDGDLEIIESTGQIWLWVTGLGAHPPVAMSAASPFKAEPPADVAIEDYGGGFIIADYRDGARFCGLSMDWSSQPVIGDPFPSEREAIEASLQI